MTTEQKLTKLLAAAKNTVDALEAEYSPYVVRVNFPELLQAIKEAEQEEG